ncbi:MBL fold metallo-hydrolase [Isobaculum melis]|uniref:Glyoxylase, beta-lactamase superfamily II n=1 Tax=Isobaculum melis TaxID=142588 RepID=A0A1H9TLA5_9LACT|nr:MBL fold metallo-hydrolase [Isobaculum melis]SER97699.1 Glyoxylase, beta-lactamase superfamily II [Isobaculum melis]
MLKITRIKTGAIEENCYLISNETTCLVIDPGAEPEKIITTIDQLKVKPAAILLTHCHFDHIGALEEIRTHYQIPVYVHPAEQSWLGDPSMNLSYKMGRTPVIANEAEYEFDMKHYDLGAFSFKVVPTPGHSIGSVSFIFDGFVIVGDALFKGSVGRTDIPTGDSAQLLESIVTQLFTLPDEMVAYPGHGDHTTIGHEKATNPFFNH